MVAQLDSMQGTTPAPTRPASSASTYAIGPIAPARLVTWKAMLTTGHEITLRVPKQLPLSVLTHQAFKAGMDDGYFACDLDHMTATQTVSDIYQYLYFAVDEEDSMEWCADSIGFVVGELSWLIGIAKMRALTGLAHLDFLLSFFPLDPLSFPEARVRSQMRHEHHEAMRSYRAHFEGSRIKGQSDREAERLTLTFEAQRRGEAWSC